MEYAQHSLQQYLDEAASGSPTPGGGSVAALAGALAASMGAMVGAFTLASPKYAEGHARMAELREAIEGMRRELVTLMQADSDAYAHVGAAYALPRATDTDKDARRAAIRDACRGALLPPLHMTRVLAQLAAVLPEVATSGNRNLISDTGVAAYLCRAAFLAARLNVLVNVGALGDDAVAIAARDEVAAICGQVEDACAEAAAIVESVVC